MKTILIPTDFSKYSAYAFETAAALAKKVKAKLHLFNAAETGAYYFSSAEPIVIAPPAGIMIEGINENLKKASMKKLEKLKKDKIFNGIDVTVKSDTTINVHESIIEYAADIKASIIIMGTRGAGGIKGIVLGTTAERVVRFSPIPVIVIPVKVKNPVPKIIVFASDFTKEAYKVFPFIQNLAGIYGSQIHLLKINTRDNFAKTGEDEELISKFNKSFGGKYKYAIYSDYMKEEGILNYSDRVQADLIAIGTHGKTGLRRFFSEDVSEGVVRLSHKPVLIVNIKKPV